MSTHTPVLIVGGGPVGLALAGELGWRGVDCTLVEKTDGTIEQPKMDLVGIRTMEFCRRWGILDWVRDAPYPLDYPQDYVYVTGLNGYELGREPFPGRGFEPCPLESPQKRERVPQDMFDPILRRFAERTPHATLRYNCELVSFTETPDGVSARVRDSKTGKVFPGSGGRHVVVPVLDASDVPRFLTDLHARCWLNGFGWGITSAPFDTTDDDVTSSVASVDSTAGDTLAAEDDLDALVGGSLAELE